MSPLKKMRRCVLCNAYMLSASHCGAATISAHPARFNPDDPFGDYRRRARYGTGSAPEKSSEVML